MEIFTHVNIGIVIISAAIGGLITTLWVAKVKPFGDEWLKEKLGRAHDKIKELHNEIDDLEVRQNTNMESIKKLIGTQKFLSERARYLEGQNNDLGETIIALSNEKSEWQDRYNVLFVERDAARAEVVRLTNDGRFAVNKDGRLQKEKITKSPNH